MKQASTMALMRSKSRSAGFLRSSNKARLAAAKVSGAPQWRVFWRVFFPLLQPAFVGVWIWTILHVVRAAGKPLILTKGAENEVLAVVIWNMWDQGYMGAVGAIGTMLMLSLLVVTLLVRKFGFGRGSHIQEAR